MCQVKESFAFEVSVDFFLRIEENWRVILTVAKAGVPSGKHLTAKGSLLMLPNSKIAETYPVLRI